MAKRKSSGELLAALFAQIILTGTVNAYREIKKAKNKTK